MFQVFPPLFLRQSVTKGFSGSPRQGINRRCRKAATKKQNGQELYKQLFHYLMPSIFTLACSSICISGFSPSRGSRSAFRRVESYVPTPPSSVHPTRPSAFLSPLVLLALNLFYPAHSAAHLQIVGTAHDHYY